MDRLNTIQDVERAYALAPEPSQPQGQPKPRAAASAGTPVVENSPAFRFIGERVESKVELLYPFEVNGIEYHEYTLRRLNAEQVAEVGQVLRSTGDMAVLYAAIASIPYIACKQMDADDAEVLASRALGFMPATLRQILAS